MTYTGLAFCLALLAFGVANALSSLASLLAFQRMDPEREPVSLTLLLIRSLPTAVSLLFVGAFFLPAFLWLEPRETDETVSLGMLSLTGACAMVLAAGPLRGVLSTLATRRLVQRWEKRATPVVLPGCDVRALAVDETFPLVAVVGIWRPKLFVARQVLEHCTPAEVAAIVSHEKGHVLHRDNLKRLLLRSLPDVMALTPLASTIEGAWREASEREADDHAARGGASLELASALVKVARLVPSRDPWGAPVTALYRGEDLARRVKRLLDGSEAKLHSDARHHRLRPVAALSLALLAFGLDLELLRRLHEVTEVVVRFFQ